MSNYDFLAPPRKRQSLLIVEGNHEKNVLFGLLLKAFPEIDIRDEDIVIFGTNIYLLYAMLVKEYGDAWDEEDVDLPFLISKEKKYETKLRKDDFNNIILVFDYERHDPGFSEEKICRMQRFFSDVTDCGRLYINYPMIESYQDFEGWPDERFAKAVCPVEIRQGKEYKNRVKDTMVAKLVGIPRKLDEILEKKFGVKDKQVRTECIERILLLHGAEELSDKIEEVLSTVISGKELQTAKHLVADVVKKTYCDRTYTYYEFVRQIFIEIIKQNIRKAGMTIGKAYDVPEKQLRDAFEQIDFADVLDAENKASKDAQGKILVLNTSVLFIPEYRFDLIEQF